MLCKRCSEIMNKTLRIEKGKSYELYKCPKCYTETKPIRIKLPEYNTMQEKRVQKKTKPKNRKAVKNVLRIHNNHKKHKKA